MGREGTPAPVHVHEGSLTRAIAVEIWPMTRPVIYLVPSAEEKGSMSSQDHDPLNCRGGKEEGTVRREDLCVRVHPELQGWPEASGRSDPATI